MPKIHWYTGKVLYRVGLYSFVYGFDHFNILTEAISGHLSVSFFLPFFFFFFSACHLQLTGKPTVRKSQDGEVFKRITGRLCQTTQDKEITFTNPTLWCALHKMCLSSAIIEHWAGYYCAGVISNALSLLTFKVPCFCPVSDLENVWSVSSWCCIMNDSLTCCIMSTTTTVCFCLHLNQEFQFL